MKGLIIIAALLLTGCGSDKTDKPITKNPAFSDWDSISHINMDDGMPCIVYKGLKKGGITCDWDYKTRTKPKLIKFYTIPGYNCDTGIIPGHCSNLNITQAEYDKTFFKEMK